MTARRQLAHVTLGGALLFGLTACQQPAPQVTLVSGTHSIHAEASHYCDTGSFVNATDCYVKGAPLVSTISANQGDVVGIDVDKALTKKAWYVFDLDTKQSVSDGLVKKQYFQYHADFTGRPDAGKIKLEIVSLAALPKSDTDVPPIKGVWVVTITQKS